MPTIAYTGCRTTAQRNARGCGIEVFAVDEQGNWVHRQSVGDLVNPSFLLVDQERHRLYCVHGDESEVSAFRIDARSGVLTRLNTQSTQGANPVHLCLTQSGDSLVVANYANGTAVALPVEKDGRLGLVASTLRFTGDPGPHASEQRGPHPHQVLRLPGTDRFVFPDKGTDSIWFAEYDSARQAWRPDSLLRLDASPGAGPRHGALHPTRALLYIVNELDSTLATYQLSGQTGCELITMSDLLPGGFTGHNQSAGIALDRTAERVFVSNRGHDTISMLAIDPATGIPHLSGWVPSDGRTPRFITVDAAQRNLVVANEGSDAISLFPIHDVASRYALGTPRRAVNTGSPTCVAFLSL
ncbi:lactonase family protein [Cupriavidus numazuensis]|uniref:6-phosphogluconolactonase n=1 Tax=Cupriavidus numazuensis TaxID=221992 RepID=A0ABM8TLI0_9BURK|nr:lactonase family protein [Cupriavidus numazuensis]CAG2153676.1 6-phosphogluconolactonase [Cupriavidus numazuensis]